MIVIGKNDDGYICSCTKKEVNQIGGYFYADGKVPNLNPGDQIAISELYDQLQNMANKANKLSNVVADLRDLANKLELKIPIIQDIITP